MDSQEPTPLFPRPEYLRSENPTLDEFVGEWWDRRAQAVDTCGDLIVAVPLLVRWILPILGQERVRDLGAEALVRFIDEVKAAGATNLTVDACLDLLDDVIAHAAERGVMSHTGPDDPDMVVWPRDLAVNAVVLPSRLMRSIDPDAA